MAEPLLADVVRPSPVELYRVRDALMGTRTLRDGIRYHRVRAGVYAPRAAWDGLAPWERYLARVHAYAIVNPDALFAYESAAALLGLPITSPGRDGVTEGPRGGRRSAAEPSRSRVDAPRAGHDRSSLGVTG
jgi:hypothetical protein